MQAPSEMYTKLQCRATDVLQAMEKYPFVQVLKQQLEYLLSHSPLNTFSAQGTSTTVGSAGVNTRQEPEAMSIPHWTVGVAMELLNKLSTVPAFLTSTVHWATVVASRVIHTLSGALKIVNSRIQGKTTRSAEKRVQKETRNDESAPEIVNVGDIRDTEEVHTEQSAEPGLEKNALVYTEQAAEPSHVKTSVCIEEAAGSNTEEDEVSLSSHTVSADICETQQPTAKVQSSTQEKSEANTAAARPHINPFYSFFRRSVAAQLPRES